MAIGTKNPKHGYEFDVLLAPDWPRPIPHHFVKVTSPVSDAPVVPLKIRQGVNWVQRILIRDVFWDRWDLQNWMLRMKARDGNEALVLEFTEGKLTTTDPIKGRVKNGMLASYVDLVLTAAQSALLDFANAQYDIELVKVNYTHIGIGSPDASFTSAALVKGASQGTVTANGGTPFSGFAAGGGDLVRLGGCEESVGGAGGDDNPDSLNNDTYTTASASGTVLTLTKPLGYGNGFSNAADTALTVSKMTLDEDNVICLMSGPLQLELEQTYD